MIKDKEALKKMIQNTFTGFMCGIRPHLDTCSGCQYVTSPDGLKCECNQAIEFADILYEKLPKKVLVNSLNGNMPTIVCLCGSTRFGEAFREAQFQETMNGKIVLTIGCNMKSDADLFGHMAEPTLQVIKNQLDELHKRKIDLANEVLILNVNSYIGESTFNELEYAKAHGKRIRFLEEIGAPGIRDPEHPCEDFKPIGGAYGNANNGECESDGHYKCLDCVCREPLTKDDLPEEGVTGGTPK